MLTKSGLANVLSGWLFLHALLVLFYAGICYWVPAKFLAWTTTENVQKSNEGLHEIIKRMGILYAYLGLLNLMSIFYAHFDMLLATCLINVIYFVLLMHLTSANRRFWHARVVPQNLFFAVLNFLFWGFGWFGKQHIR